MHNTSDSLSLTYSFLRLLLRQTGDDLTRCSIGIYIVYIRERVQPTQECVTRCLLLGFFSRDRCGLQGGFVMFVFAVIRENHLTL